MFGGAAGEGPSKMSMEQRLRRRGADVFYGMCCWRPRPESNRGIRICSPLRHHSATWPSGWTF